MQSTPPVELEYPRRMPSNLSERIRRLRELRGVDLRTFATRAGLSQSVISNFLTRASRNPATSMNADNLAAIAKAWGADPAWLFTGDGEAPTKTWTEAEPQEGVARAASPALAPRTTGGRADPGRARARVRRAPARRCGSAQRRRRVLAGTARARDRRHGPCRRGAQVARRRGAPSGARGLVQRRGAVDRDGGAVGVRRVAARRARCARAADRQIINSPRDIACPSLRAKRLVFKRFARISCRCGGRPEATPS